MKCVTAVAVAVLLAVACGDDAADPPSCLGVPDFKLDISSVAGWLPESTLVSVTFGGGVEEYSPSAPHKPVVLFCETRLGPLGMGEGGGAGAGGGAVHPTPAGGVPSSGGTDGSADAGAGAGGALVIRSIHCELWTGGPATLEVEADKWDEKLDLQRDPELCTPLETLVLGDEPPQD